MNNSSKQLLARIGNTVCMAVLAASITPFMMTIAKAQSCLPNMISYWKLDDATGFVATDSVDANHGTLINGPTWTSGQVGGALELSNGVPPTYVDIPDNDSLDFGTNRMTIEAWIYPTAFDEPYNIVARWGPSGQRVWVMNMIGGGVLGLNINADHIRADGNTLISLNEWHHVVGTFDGNWIKVYLDGNVDGQTAFTGTIIEGTNHIRFGAGNFGSGHPGFDGKIDEVAAYNRALTPVEIQQHYQNGLNGQGYCATSYTCEGFESPLNSGSVTVRKKRALPLKAQLFATDGSPVTDADIAPPVLQVIYTPATGGDPIDVTDDALAVGLGTEGNQFEFNVDKWQYNLKTDNYTASGTYTMTMVPGDGYVINPACQASFVIK